MHRNLRWALLGIPIFVFACSSSEAVTPSSSSPDTADDDPDERAPTPAPTPTPAPVPAAETSKIDPAACADIASRAPGSFASDPPFEVSGASKVAADFDEVKRLALAFDWPAKRVQDGHAVWRYDARLSLALELLEPNADRTFPVSATPYAVRIWKYDRHERACTTMAIGHEEPFGGEPMDGTGTLLITKRSDAEIEGAIVLKDAKGAVSTLSFRAPIVATLQNDVTLCCLATLGGG